MLLLPTPRICRVDILIGDRVLKWGEGEYSARRQGCVESDLECGCSAAQAECGRQENPNKSTKSRLRAEFSPSNPLPFSATLYRNLAMQCGADVSCYGHVPSEMAKSLETGLYIQKFPGTTRHCRKQFSTFSSAAPRRRRRSRRRRRRRSPPPRRPPPRSPRRRR